MKNLTQEQLDTIDQAARMLNSGSNIVQVRSFMEEKGLPDIHGMKFDPNPVIAAGLEPPVVNNHVRRAVTEIIPGYLARILQDTRSVENKRVGFWGPVDGLPMPVANAEPWDGQETFLEKLIDLELSLNTAYIAVVKRYNDAAHAGQVPTADDLDDGNVVGYRGSSHCRICKESNGSHEYVYEGWTWPEGYRHYLEVHNVIPDVGFKDFILSL